MKNKRFDIKIFFLLLISVAMVIGMFYILKIQSTKNDSVISSRNIDEQIEKFKQKESKIDKLINESNVFLKQDDSFLNDLKSYIQLPETESEYNSFIGVVKNNYPFGNPIQEEKK